MSATSSACGNAGIVSPSGGLRMNVLARLGRVCLVWGMLASAPGLLGGCAANPWKGAFIPDAGATPFAPTEQVEIRYVDAFETLSPDADTSPSLDSGLTRIGHANFTGIYHQGSENELRAFARTIGADHVRWGLKFLHRESDTRLAAVSNSQVVPHGYRDRHGKRRTDYDVVTTTTHVPVTEERAYYVFRALFFRSR